MALTVTKIDAFNNVAKDTSSLDMVNCDATDKADLVVLGIKADSDNVEAQTRSSNGKWGIAFANMIPIDSISGSTVNFSKNAESVAASTIFFIQA
jgi:hypothetical protein